MQVVRSAAEAGPARRSVVSIGNFDGVHLGHRAILETVVRRAAELNCRSVAMTFAPHPIRFLAPYKAPRLISTLRQKIEWIAATGIEVLLVVNFDEPFSRLSPEAFIDRYLLDELKACSVAVGSNFNFGYRGTGSVETLRERVRGLEVVEVTPVEVRQGLVSSTRVRELIGAGEVSLACRLLGRWPELEGPIVAGAGRGRAATVPTLNLQAENELLPGKGVYVTQIAMDGGPFVQSVTNIGMRPTFHESTISVETFVLKDPVPESVRSARLQFVKRLRDEIRFDSAETLRRQIDIDVRRTLQFNRRLAALHHARSHSR
jgi:riboflavin kinase/FMN adenylyltransferase